MRSLIVILVTILCYFNIISITYSIEDNEPEDINEYDRWRFEYTNMDKVWSTLNEVEYRKGEKNEILVAVIDTGIDTNHPDLELVQGYDFGNDDDNPMDFSGHGTHVAGIIGAELNNGNDNVIGVAPGVQILPIKVFANLGYSLNSDIVEGIDYAISKNVDVINYSVGDYYNEEIAMAFERAEEAGIVVVASASNDSNNWIDSEDYHQKFSGQERRSEVVLYPAALENVIAVGSVMKHPTKDELGISDFSNIGGIRDYKYRSIDVVAPGSNILSTNMSSDTKGRVMSGTSMAAPHVTGMVALIRAQFPQLTPYEVRDIVRTTAYDPGIVIPEGYSKMDTIGCGLIDIDAAINYSALTSLYINDVELEYDFKKYNYLVSVDSDIKELTLFGELRDESKLYFNGIECNGFDEIKVILEDQITVFNLEIEKYGIRRQYKFFVKYNQPLTSSRVKRLVIDSSVNNPIITENNMDYYVTLNPNNDLVKFKIDTYDSTDQIAIVTYDGETDYIYDSSSEIEFNLTDKTTVAAFKVKTKEGEISSYMMAFIKEDNSSGIYKPKDVETTIVTRTVSIKLDTDAVVLDYGVDAEERYKSYNFQSTVKGADKDDVEWSVDNTQYVAVDKEGIVRIKEDVPDGLGDFSVKLKAQSIVGGAVAYADILFVEKTPLGKIEFNAPYVSGYSDGTFRPRGIVTRAEVATIFAKILNLPLMDKEVVFSDVTENHWAQKYVNAVGKIGLFSGYSDGTFKPDNPISRAEIAQVFTNYWKYSNIEVNPKHVISIPDVSDDFWASNAIHRLYNSRVTSGYINNAFRPFDETLREELVYMVNRLIGRDPYRSLETSFKDVPMSYFYHGDIEAASRFYVSENDLPTNE